MKASQPSCHRETPQFIEGLKTLIEEDSYDVFIVDLWGVIHNGAQPLEGVRTCLEKLKSHHRSVFFLSNSPRRVVFLEKQLSSMGLSKDLYNEIYSSGENAFEVLSLSQPLGLAYLAVAFSHHELVYDLKLEVTDNIHKAAFIFNTGPEPLTLEEHIPWLEQAAYRNLPMICVNPDIKAIAGDSLKLCAGALASHYINLGGKVSYHGKPYPAVYEALLKKLTLWQGKETNLSRILIVGDSLNTDILGANTMGIDSLLVLSGLETNGLYEDFQGISPFLLNRMTHKKIYPSYVSPGFRW